ncbi:hypothetical protein ACTXT7_014752 [Hymenolepis weldensis]
MSEDDVIARACLIKKTKGTETENSISNIIFQAVHFHQTHKHSLMYCSSFSFTLSLSLYDSLYLMKYIK